MQFKHRRGDRGPRHNDSRQRRKGDGNSLISNLNLVKTSLGRFFYAFEVYRYLIIMEFTLLDSILLITFVVSLAVFIQQPVPLYLRLFPIYFLIMLMTDMRGEYLGLHGHYNTGLYNISAIAEFWFFHFVLRQVIRNVHMRRIILSVLFIYPLFSALVLLFFQKQPGFNSINFMIGCLITVIFCIYYYIELFQEAESRSLAQWPSFWIVSAMFFNNVCTFPLFALVSYMSHLPKLISNNISNIQAILSIMTSILYSIGFLCRIRISKSIL